jgi:acyl carrier protein
MHNIEAKLKEIMSLVFELPEDQIEDNSSPEDIDKWDSLGTINLITALEEEFDVEFEEEDILEMLNFQLIKLKIEEKLQGQ